jgi:hypothetical protein
VNEMLDGAPGPCQPIGCDNGHHLDGCYFAEIDLALARPIPGAKRSYRALSFGGEAFADRPPRDLGESTSAELRRVKAELGSALSHINRVTSEVTDLREANQALRAEIDDRSRRLLLAEAELSTARAQLARIQPTEGATPA